LLFSKQSNEPVTLRLVLKFAESTIIFGSDKNV